MNVLVTGGAGYIGSHAALRLITDGHDVTVLDDLSRGNMGALDALRSAGPLYFVRGDVGDVGLVTQLLQERRVELVMHFAALTYVGESVQEPLRYYRTNLGGAIGLLEAMHVAGVNRIVFSSTAATYGEPDAGDIPITESCPQRPVNPYGATKLAVERLLEDRRRAAESSGRDDFAYAALRYFNVAGCDASGRLGEDHDPETHLIPICLDAAAGRRERVTIFGTDYPTPDGTCIRDYVHVEDLVDAHVTVMKALRPLDGRAYNVGIGEGHSVRRVLDACRRVTRKPILADEGARRSGDPPVLYADPGKIRRDLGWSARFRGLDSIVESAWRWWKAHPDGYDRSGRRPVSGGG